MLIDSEILRVQDMNHTLLMTLRNEIQLREIKIKDLEAELKVYKDKETSGN